MKFKLLLLALFVPALLYPQWSKPHDNYTSFPRLPAYKGSALDSVVRTDFTVTLSDGTVLDALKFVPIGTIPVGGWPTIIMVHGYGDNKETLAASAKAQAQFGYYVTTFSMRGQGLSTGLSNLISRTEAGDMKEYAEFIKNDIAGGANPNNILIMGGSQGGLVPFMAACTGMNVKTIISALAPPDFASRWIENGSVKMTFLWTVSYTPDTARYTPQVASMSNWVYANNKDKWDSLAHWLPINRDFMSIVPNNTVPILIEGSWQDKFFNASGIMKSSALLSSPFRLYLGAVQGHGGDHSPSEDTWHMQFFNDWILFWMFNTGSLNAFKYQYAYTTNPRVNNAWTFVHDSSSTSLSQIAFPYRLYFNRGGSLKPTVNPFPAERRMLPNRVTGGLTMQEAVDEEFTGPAFNSKFRVNSFNFVSDSLTTDMLWLGTPKIGIDYQSTGNTFCQFNFQVFDVKPDGTADFVNRLNFTDRDYVSNSRRTKQFDGSAHSHLFKAGHRIRLVVTNLDRTSADSLFLGTNPFVLPVLVNANNFIYLDSSSYIELPVTSVPTKISDPLGGNIPHSFELKQNYPNPFNPSTVISYSIPAASVVKLTVYDVKGAQVRVLVNESRQPGNYSVRFDALGLSSGVYFYRLDVSGPLQDFTEVRKMILIK